MATEFGSIDDMLMGGDSSLTPPTPESKQDDLPPETPENLYDEEESYNNDTESHEEEEQEQEEPEQEQESEKKLELDEYGNEKAAPRTYTEEEVNERINKAIRDRLARGNVQNQQPTQQQVDQAKGFEYDPESEGNWETQLEKFVEKTFSKMTQKQEQQKQQARDEQQQAEFEDKFSRGMSRFSDFREVVSAQPVTDPMTYALRGLSDPAAFIYAASKRHPQELARISQIPDPAAQIMEMGRLEERMKKAPVGTKAPKPISRSRDDGGMPSKSKSTEPTIEDLIAKSDAKRKAQLNQKRGR